jgi:uncharacterized protein DUF4437
MKILMAACAMAAALCARTALAEDQVTMNPGDIKWGDAPPVLPKGAKLAVLNGDPSKPGQYTIRLRAPANYKIAPHWHSLTENLTIVSGTLYLGMGDKMDMKAAHALKTGGYHYLPAKQHHFALTKVPTVIQISGEGPFDINYLDEKDNPMGKKK